MICKFHWITGIIPALAITFAANMVSAQVYFSEDFNNVTTSGLLNNGWHIGNNDKAAEVGTEFIVTPDWGKSANPRPPGTNTGIINPPQADGTASTGEFLLSDSDRADGSDNITSEAEWWAITPSFSTVGANQVWFHANLEVESNNNGEGIAEIAATADDGATWHPIWQMIEPQRPIKAFNNNVDGAARTNGYPEIGGYSQTKTWSGVHGRVHWQLPAAVVNQADVKIRFMWYEPADAWWFAVDDIVVDNQGPPMGNEVIFEEDFENGIPSTWSNTSAATGKTQTWGTNVLWDPDFDEPKKWINGVAFHIDLLRNAELWGVEIDLENPHPEVQPNGTSMDGRWILQMAGGNYALWQEDNPAPVEGEAVNASNLDTPAINLSSATAVFLDFDSEVLVSESSGGNNRYEVFASTDDGANWSRIYTYHEALMNYGETSYFDHHYLSVPSAAGSSNVKFRFHAEGQGNNMQGFWVIDNVRVTANTGATHVTDWNLF